MQEIFAIPEYRLYALDALAHVPPTLKVLMWQRRDLTDAEWAMMPKEVQLNELVTLELSAGALDHLSEATHVDVARITEEAVAHLPTKVPHLRSLSVARLPRDMVMRLSCMPDLEELSIKKGHESAINLCEGFPALQHMTFVGKCRTFSAHGMHIADATAITVDFS